MANRFRQFRLLLWKNFILQIRRPIGTAFEILLPIVLISVLILPKIFLKPEDICFSSYKPLSSVAMPTQLQMNMRTRLLGQNVSVNDSLALAYHPSGPAVSGLMSSVASTMNIKVVNRSMVHNKDWTSVEQMVAEVAEHEDKYLAAVVFDVEKDKLSLPKVVKYTLRMPHSSAGERKTWRTERTYPNFQGIGARTTNFYTFSGFAILQYAIDMAIIQAKASLPFPFAYPMNIKQLPYPGYVQDFFVQTVANLLPLLLTLAFIYSAVSIIKELVFEKQQRLKESMKMMGLSNWIHWSAWFIKCLLFLGFTIIIITIFVKVLKIFEFSNGIVVFLFFLCYIISMISYCFFISVFFSNPTLSMLFGSVLWYAALLPYQLLAQNENYDTLSQSAKASMCLLPNTCLGIGATLIARLEGFKTGASFSNLASSPSADDHFSLAWVLGMMIISSLVYLILTWYISTVFPGQYGIPKPFYFPFMKSYWCGFSHDDVVEAGLERELGDVKTENNPAIEDEPTDLAIGVQIKDLRKVFKGSTGSKVAVDNLSLNMYKGQITALLGHNGAGKTTTMSILTGLFTPTSGSAMIDNKSILTDIDGIRESLGLCPQHNVLFDRLTVEEHLEFFINLKGKYGQAAKDEVLQMITDLQLLDKRKAKSSELSGGMKRKLNCAIALVGGSETVFLDEPTSGMDPYARRATWDLLLKHKAGKTVILTTHFMDEADFLGDRIAIMADGQLRCCGSSLFLKSRYGVGYHLTLVKKEDCDDNAIINAVRETVPSAQVLSNVGAEIEFVLNGEASKDFESLFVKLENNKEDYGIASYGVSCTTMEEVFMKVGEGSEKTVEDIDHEHHRETEKIIDMAATDEDPDMGELQTGFALQWQHYKAMLVKRFINSKRDKKSVVTQILLPMVMVLFGLLIMNTGGARGNDPARLLNLKNLSTDGVNTKVFFADFRNRSNTAQAQATLQRTRDHLATVKADTVDVTNKVYDIRTKNALDGIHVVKSSYNYTTSAGNCCNYKFLVLNEHCRNDFLDGNLTSSNCSNNDNFGYKHCDKCLNSQTGKGCNPPSISSTNLADMNTYFDEYVLEESNAKQFFYEYVAGVTIGPLPSPGYVVPATNVTNASVVPPKVELPSSFTTVWYSNQGYHIIASSINALSNILLAELSGDSEQGIETTNHPLPNNAQNKADNVTSTISVLFLAIFMSMGMAFMAASFITFLVQERTSKAKHLQFVSGVDAFSYWSATYTWDFLNYLVPCLLILILFAAFQIEEFENDMGSVFLLLILFGLVVLPFIYVMSFAFKSQLIAYAMTVFVLSIMSFGMLLAVFLCRIPSLNLLDEAEIMHYVFMLLPTYTVSYALIDMSTNYGYRKICSTLQTVESCRDNGIQFTDSSLNWDRPGVGQHALYMAVEAVVLFILTLLIQVNFFIGARVRMPEDDKKQGRPNEDCDVAGERARVHSLNPEQIKKESVIVKDLTKVYHGSDRTAVDHLCIGIPRGECFGLLGVNGAGKTTTFSMLTGDQSISEGTAYLDGYDIQTHLKEVQQRIGYCPQFDAFIERMTGREMLTMFARLRGVQPDKIPNVVSTTIEHLNLGKWADKLCGDYSGGNKRKLSTAIALVGNPPIIFLDEPTTGMDPVARRFLWDSLTHVMKGGRSIVLTSHSMEECEALCTRLAIMVNGQFKCVGSAQHLKSRFGMGYTLMLKVEARLVPVSNTEVANSSQVVAMVPGSTPPSTATAAYDNPVAVTDAGMPDVNGPGYPVQRPEISPPPGASAPTPIVSAHGIGNQPVPVMYTVDLLGAVQQAQQFVSSTFPGAQLLESHNGMLTYQINSTELSWSRIFGELERNRASLNIVDYSVSQTSLEQVFLNLAKEQYSEERTKVKRTCGCLPC
ncbi:phospholipid-transporting ATPase ABCA3 isoform X2 [Nematostella vectensis]|uniref:phospholipid-transporting ATPase ABCA3 isoform X2 n=1 Tax=Nematostella vectensis TaxID=45351 RepID=UPI00139008D7|nr:phospholipid-transporting ATPase ABCA3 isoform X2 [Nematostella vectensis]